jgi:hypothetical protein
VDAAPEAPREIQTFKLMSSNETATEQDKIESQKIENILRNDYNQFELDDEREQRKIVLMKLN